VITSTGARRAHWRCAEAQQRGMRLVLSKAVQVEASVDLMLAARNALLHAARSAAPLQARTVSQQRRGGRNGLGLRRPAWKTSGVLFGGATSGAHPRYRQRD